MPKTNLVPSVDERCEMTERPRHKDLKGEFESLWRSTVDQFDEITDVLVKTSQAGKAKLDATLLRRERDAVLVKLGAAVKAAPDRERLPEAWQALIHEACALDARIDEEEKRFGRVFSGTDDERSPEG
jgi:hypothetical protein